MNNKYWIALEQAQGIGPAHLMEIYNTITSLNLSIIDIFDLNDKEIEEEFNFSRKILDGIISSKSALSAIEDIYSNLLDSEIDIIPFFSNEYPARFKEILGNSFPPILYTFGNRKILNNKGIAILGDKYVSEKGQLISYMAAKKLSRHKIVTISGLASGVDMIAHRSALENDGDTIAIIPYGAAHFKQTDFIKNIQNPDRILIISPFYPTRESNRFNAFIRNKIICALSYAVYIVEAPVEGGIFEAGKSAKKLGTPLFTTEYAEYPKNAYGNKKIIEELNGIPVRGKLENNMLTPNMDKMIGLVKFS